MASEFDLLSFVGVTDPGLPRTENERRVVEQSRKREYDEMQYRAHIESEARRKSRQERQVSGKCTQFAHRDTMHHFGNYWFAQGEVPTMHGFVGRAPPAAADNPIAHSIEGLHPTGQVASPRMQQAAAVAGGAQSPEFRHNDRARTEYVRTRDEPVIVLRPRAAPPTTARVAERAWRAEFEVEQQQKSAAARPRSAASTPPPPTPGSGIAPPSAGVANSSMGSLSNPTTPVPAPRGGPAGQSLGPAMVGSPTSPHGGDYRFQAASPRRDAAAAAAAAAADVPYGTDYNEDEIFIAQPHPDRRGILRGPGGLDDYAANARMAQQYAEHMRERAEHDRRKAMQRDMRSSLDSAVADKQRRRAQTARMDAKDTFGATLPVPSVRQPMNRSRLEMQHQRRAELERVWQQQAADHKARQEAERQRTEPDRSMWWLDAERREAEARAAAETRRTASDDAKESWRRAWEEHQVAEATTARRHQMDAEELEARTLSANIANYADRIVLAERQRKEAQKSFRAELDAQVRERQTNPRRSLVAEGHPREQFFNHATPFGRFPTQLGQ